MPRSSLPRRGRRAAGYPHRFIGVIEEFTEKRFADQAAHESAARLQIGIGRGPLGRLELGSRDGFSYPWARGGRDFRSDSRHSDPVESFGESLHEGDREVVRLAVEDSLDHHSDYAIEYGSGAEWGLLLGHGEWTGIYAADGTVLGMIGVIQDISERKRAEEARLHLAAVVESSEDAIFSMTMEAVILTWNRGAQRMYGYVADEVIGKSVTLLIPPNRENEEPGILERLKVGERVEHYETVRVRKDGTLVDVSLSVSPIHDAKGKITGVSKISRDISERKRAEEALRDETRTLELLNSTGLAIAAQLEIKAIVQTVTDAATQLTGASFGAFFYNLANAQEESFLLYGLAGVPREKFEKLGFDRNAPRFAWIVRGQVWSDRAISRKGWTPERRGLRLAWLEGRWPFGAISQCPSFHGPANPSAGCSLATRERMCSRSAANGSSAGWRLKRQWRLTTPAFMKPPSERSRNGGGQRRPCAMRRSGSAITRKIWKGKFPSGPRPCRRPSGSWKRFPTAFRTICGPPCGRCRVLR